MGLLLKEGIDINLIKSAFLAFSVIGFLITLINKHAFKFFTLYFFYIFIHLYNGAILERLTKSKKVNK